MTLKTNTGTPNTKRQFTADHFEMIIWTSIFIYIAADLFTLLVIHNKSLSDVFAFSFEKIVIVVIALFLAVIFKVIFGQLPVAMIMRRIGAALSSASVEDSENNQDLTDPLDVWNVRKVAAADPLDYLASLAISSRKLSKGLRTKSSVYLFIGVAIAFTGLFFFYYLVSTSGDQSLSFNEAKQTAESNQYLIRMAQNFGILFFIEFVAFFFLKQYRSAMDEFRYYESLQRYREETLAILKFIKAEREANPEKADKDLDIFTFVEKCGFRTSVDKLEKGQTTELLETKKLNKDEAEIFKQILDILAKK